MLRTLTGLMLLVVSFGAFGLSEGRLISQSSSGQTALFNLGNFDGVMENDYAVIVKKIKDLETLDLRLVPVAKAKNIKVSTDSSIWVLYHIYDAELLVNNQKYMLLTETNMLRGQRQPRVTRTTVVAPKGQGAQVAKNAVSDDTDRIAKLKDEYDTITKIRGKTYRSDNDFDIIDLDEWEKSKGERYKSALYRSPHKDEFRRSYRVETFQQLVAAYLKKVNDPNFNYEKFYEDQMRDAESGLFRTKTHFNTEYEDFLANQSIKKTEDAKVYRSILEKGESWSEDFSDEELRKVLGKVSVLQEKDRRIFVVSRPLRHAFHFEFALPLNESQTQRDATYRRDARYAVAIDYEVTPLLRHPVYERFTLNATGRINKSAFETSGSNVDMDEISATLGVNWYPLHAPYVIAAPVIFAGLYVRSGQAQVFSPIASEKANYMLLALPGYRAGVKYIFKNNVGLRIVTSMETLHLEQYESTTFNSVLPANIDVVEAKLAVGLSYTY